jgi:D-tyrosyl-tRNA(Tyr) deacylase
MELCYTIVAKSEDRRKWLQSRLFGIKKEIDQMKFVIQRVAHASVSVDGEVIGKIGRGYMVLIGVCEADDEAVADKMVDKMIKLRINEDAEGKTNLSLADVDGGLLLISQFTLYANCKKGNRPSFIEAGSPEHANAIYEYIIEKCRDRVPVVEKGSFGAEMKVELLNDGPFTILLDSDTL